MGDRITAADYFAAFLTAAHLAFCARDIATLTSAETFRRRRFPGSVPIGPTGCGVLARPGLLRSGTRELVQQAAAVSRICSSCLATFCRWPSQPSALVRAAPRRRPRFSAKPSIAVVPDVAPDSVP